MEEPTRIDELPFELLVNGISVQSVQIRSVPASDDFQILMTDPQLGRFSLTGGVRARNARGGFILAYRHTGALDKGSYREQRILADGGPTEVLGDGRAPAF